MQSDVECYVDEEPEAMGQCEEGVVGERAHTSGGDVWQSGGVVEGRRNGVWSPIGWGKPDSNPNDMGEALENVAVEARDYGWVVKEMPLAAWLCGCGVDFFGELCPYLKKWYVYFRTEWTRVKVGKFVYLL